MEQKEMFGVSPYVTAQKLLAGKWTMYILYLLSEKPVRFNEILRMMPEDMTHTTLARHLKQLETEGLVKRKEYRRIPPKVEYSLSDMGDDVKPVLGEMGVLGRKYIEYLKSRKDEPTVESTS